MAMELIGGTACKVRIENAFVEMERIFATGNTTQLDDRFGLCESLSTASELDVSYFFGSMSGPFSGLVQYHRTGDIEEVCDLLLGAGDDDLEALALYVYGPPPEEGSECWDYSFQDSVDWLIQTSFNSSAARSSCKNAMQFLRTILNSSLT